VHGWLDNAAGALTEATGDQQAEPGGL